MNMGAVFWSVLTLVSSMREARVAHIETMRMSCGEPVYAHRWWLILPVVQINHSRLIPCPMFAALGHRYGTKPCAFISRRYTDVVAVMYSVR